ncbi:translation machinery-associated protein 10 [[Candida] jaroonii]|uniref:Translation machinery-associated protein 10 n=1 Tax=[Candida] jaroonii TaxID=467808 RepID=A0ACA9YAY1_9ASCO|nr:translation machinery-associated protein 10 [[Candida] jaroonii]
MSRTDKWTVRESASEPKWFTHNGNFDTDPTKVKKGGNGRDNWGKPGDELLDEDHEYNYFGKSKRRNSNHQSHEEFLKERNEMIDHHFNKN